MRLRVLKGIVLLGTASALLLRSRGIAASVLLNGGATLLAREAVGAQPGGAEAELLYRQASALGDARAELGLGRLTYQRGDWLVAAARLGSYQKVHPNDQVGDYYYAEAVLAGEGALGIARLAAVPPQVIAYIVDKETQAGDWQTASALWQSAPRRLGDAQLSRLTLISHRLIEHALQADDCTETRFLLNQALEWKQQVPNIRPEDYFTRIYFSLGRCYYLQRDYLQATHYLQVTLARDPEFSNWPYVFLSDIALAESDRQAARGWLRRGLALYPNDSVLTARLDALGE
jgi:tetratricopeptide (TPR) repeat protein